MIRIVTDSAADLTARDLETPRVTVVPMGITFADGTATVDDGSMTKDEFFTRLAEDSKLPSTSQPSHPNAAVKAPHSAATAAFAYKKPFFLSKFPFIFKHSIHFCTNQRPPARG